MASTGAGSENASPLWRAPWEPIELLALAGLAASAAIIVVQAASGAVLFFARGFGADRVTSSLGLATSWTDVVAPVLLLVLGLVWAPVRHWSAVMTDEGFDLTGDSDRQGELPDAATQQEDPPDLESPPDPPDESTAMFDEAGRHLTRLHAVLLWTSVLLVVMFAGGAFRVVAVAYEGGVSSILAAQVLQQVGSLCFVAIVSAFGLVVAAKLTRLCHWWQ